MPYEKSFVGIIARNLERHDIEVLNAAVISYAPSIYYRKVKYLLNDTGLRFDEIVVFLDISDIHDEALFYELREDDTVGMKRDVIPSWAGAWDGHLGPGDETTGQRLRRFAKTNSVVARLSDAILDRLTGRSWSRAGEPGGLPTTGIRRSLWTVNQEHFDVFGQAGLNRCRESMNRLLSVLREWSIPLTVVVYPWPDQVLHRDLDSVQVRFWREWSARNGVEFINLFPAFFQDDDPRDVLTRYYIPHDVHFNERGNELVAETFLIAFRHRTTDPAQ